MCTDMENLRDKTLDLLTRLLEGNMVSVMGDDLIQQFIKDMLNAHQSQQQPEVSEDEEIVAIKGKLEIVPNLPVQYPYRLNLTTPAGSFFLASGSFMHCSDLQAEITAYD